MSRLTDNFLAFLLEKHKQTGQNSFIKVEYMDFDGYEKAITDLANRGVIEKTNDILGTIIVRLPNE